MVEIQELLLRIPGLNAEEARILGEEVAQRIADKLPVGVGSRYIENIDLQISLPSGASGKRLADVISARILAEIR